MKTATVRDLRYDFPKIEAWLKLGEVVEITKHRKPIGQLCPPTRKKTVAFDPQKHAELLNSIWGSRVFSSAEVEEMRAFETGEP